MIRRLLTITLLMSWLLANNLIFAQIVSNVQASQSGNTLVISYSLQSDAPCEITLNVSTDGGMTWIKPANGISGNIGTNISKGNHNIIWKVLENQEELVSNKVKFKVVATQQESFASIKIGSQLWMDRNLNVNRFRNGDLIPEAKSVEDWIDAGKAKEPVWCYYENNSAKGRLYNWFAVIDPRGLAPQGWHVPSDLEWTILIEKLGGKDTAGRQMKSKSGWANSGNGDNTSRFCGLPCGYRSYTGYFDSIGKNGYFWSSSESNDESAFFLFLSSSRSDVIRPAYEKTEGLSVRCVKN
jgi:uncharacterized protein (TIGR02145 family)